MAVKLYYSTTSNVGKTTMVVLRSTIKLKGHWLIEAGFAINTPVTVRVMEGCIVVTPKE